MKKTLFSGILMLGMAAGLVTNSVQAAEAEKDWTFLVFCNADNNLDKFGVEDMEEATRIGSSEDVNVVFQLDRFEKPTNRYFINKGNSELIEEMGEVDMGDVNQLVEFVRWGAERYPAKHYALVVWNHGSGWSKLRFAGQTFRGISYDDESGNHITTNQLHEGMADIQNYLGQKLDILAFDACLMQMAEVAYAVKDSVDVMIASEETEPGKGWPYDDVLRPVVANPKSSTEEVASAIVTAYDKSYDNGSQGTSGTTQAWVKLAKIQGLLDALDEFAAVASGKYPEQVTAARNEVQRFAEASNVDLIHLMELIQSKISDDSIKMAAQNVIDAARNFIGLSLNHGEGGSWWTGMYPLKNSNGTAIYFPNNGYSFSKKYLDLGFAEATQWDEYLNAHFTAAKTNPEDL